MFEKDLIAERDRRKKIGSAVIKRWNVRYGAVDEHELEAETENESVDIVEEPKAVELTEEEIRANEVLARLMAEAAEDEAKKTDEIEALKRAMEQQEDRVDEMAYFNRSTNAYSGMYGQKEMNDQEKDSYERIMAANKDMLNDTMRQVEELKKEAK